MARKGSGFRAAVKIVKTIDKAHKQSVRQAEQDRRARGRELAAREREIDRQFKAAERASVAEEKAMRKAIKEQEKNLFELRVQERAALRAEFVRAELS